MKTLRVIARLNIGGPARHAVILDDGLRRRGVETLLVYGQVDAGEGSLDAAVKARGLPAIQLADLGRRISPLSDVRAFVRLARIVFSERPDVLHTHTAKAGTLGRLAAFLFNATRPRRRRCLVVHTFHGHVLSGYFGPVGTLAVRLAERTLAHVTDCIITISPRQRDEIVTRFHVAPADRVAVVPLGLDLDELLALPPSTSRPPAGVGYLQGSGPPRVVGVGGGLREALGLSPDDVVFGYVGRFVPIKDVARLLEAFAIAHARIPAARLILAGDGPLRPALEKRATELGVSKGVRFIGWHSDLPALYATFDVVVLSSLNEGTPVAVIEAMAAGRPVAATDVGGVADVVVHGETGILVPSGNAGRLADALVTLAQDEGMRRRMGIAGREAVARYRSGRLVADIFDVYTRGLAEKRRASR